jgi:molecular chaperone DnaJ
LVEIIQIVKMPDGSVKIAVRGLNRVRIKDFNDSKNYMESNIHKLLSLQDNATFQEVEAAYNALYSRLSNDRFKSGQEGNDAARALHELNVEYRLYKEGVERMVKGGATGFEEVDALVKEGKVSQAQAILDSIIDRNGEWHYMQSIVLYRREWLTECRKHLVMAINLEPTNAKYKGALEKLDMIIGNGSINAQHLGNQHHHNDAHSQMRQNDMLCNCLAGACLAHLCCGAGRGC